MQGRYEGLFKLAVGRSMGMKNAVNSGVSQVLEEMVGDTGIEPVASSV